MGFSASPTGVAGLAGQYLHLGQATSNSRVAKYEHERRLGESCGGEGYRPPDSPQRQQPLPLRPANEKTLCAATAPTSQSRCSTDGKFTCACFRSTCRRAGTHSTYAADADRTSASTQGDRGAPSTDGIHARPQNQSLFVGRAPSPGGNREQLFADQRRSVTIAAPRAYDPDNGLRLTGSTQRACGPGEVRSRALSLFHAFVQGQNGNAREAVKCLAILAGAPRLRGELLLSFPRRPSAGRAHDDVAHRNKLEKQIAQSSPRASGRYDGAGHEPSLRLEHLVPLHGVFRLLDKLPRVFPPGLASFRECVSGCWPLEWRKLVRDRC